MAIRYVERVTTALVTELEASMDHINLAAVEAGTMHICVDHEQEHHILEVFSCGVDLLEEDR